MRQPPLFLQTAVNECGLACLAMVAACYDGATDLASVRRRFPGFAQGLTLKRLSGYAQSLGLTSRGIRCEPADLKNLRRPAILHWGMDHFVVLVAVRRKGCVLHDPAVGRCLRTWSELDRQFTGIVLELWPAQEAVAPAPQRKPAFGWRELWPLLRGTRAQLIWLIVLSLMLQLMLLMGPWHVQWTVDEALLAADVQLITVLALGFGLLLVCRVLTHVLRGLLIVQLGHGLSFQLASQLLQRLLRLPSGWFEARHIGDIASRFAALHPVREFLTQGAAMALVDMFMAVLSLIFMFTYSAVLAGVVLLVHLVNAAVQLSFSPRLRQLTQALVVHQATEQSHLLESVRCINAVKVNAFESSRLEQWQSLHGRTLKQSIALQHTQLGLGGWAMAVTGAELIAVIYLAAHGVLEGVLTIGMLFAFLSYRGHFAERLRTLLEQMLNLRTLAVHLNRLGEIWHEPVEQAGATVTLPGEALAQPRNLHAHGVSFSHGEDAPTLFSNVNLTVQPGEFIAIIGASGCGKSTLLKLLMGLMRPTSGQVCLGDQPLGFANARRMRDFCGAVLAEDGFFSGTLLDNLTLFEPPDLARVEACLDEVGMLQSIKQLPMGLHTRIAESHNSLSSGQLQRLLLARALYREPCYLFLDEGTANLDVVSSHAIQTAIRRLDCTRVVVTHDLAFAAAADRVLCLDGGQLQQVDLPVKSAATQSAG